MRLALVCSMLLVVGWTVPAGADIDGSVTTTQGTAFSPGIPVTLVITVEADAATSGTAVVRDDTGNDLARVAVDVPGGSSRQFLVTVQPAQWSGQIRVRYVPDSGTEFSLGTVQRSQGVTRTVAAVGTMADRLTNDASGAWPTRVAPIDPSWLGAADVRTLSGVDNVAVTGRDLAQLTPEARNEIERFVWGGGRLIVVDAAGAPAELLDRQLGVGSVVVVPAAASTSDLEDALSVGFDGDDDVVGMVVPGSLATLANDSGFSVAGYGPLLWGVLLYIALVGPALWVVLRRRRREPAIWIAVPAFALVASLTIWAIGSVRRNAVEASYASVTIDGPNGGVEIVDVLLTSTSGGFESVDLDDGWHVTPTISTDNWGGEFSQPAQLRDGRLGVELDPGGLGVVRAERWLPSPPASFDIRVEFEGSTLRGELTNTSGRALQEVTVQSGAGFRDLGDLEPNESATFVITNVDQHLLARNYLVEHLENVSNAWNGRADDGDPPVNPGAIGQAIERRPALAAPGSILATGWTADAGNGLTSGDNGRNAFVSVRPIATLIGDDAPPIVHAAISQDTSWSNEGTWLSYATELTLSESMLDQPLTLEMPRGARTMQVWDGDGWSTFGDGAGDYRVEPGWIHSGAIRLRHSSDRDPWSDEVNLPTLAIGDGG